MYQQQHLHIRVPWWQIQFVWMKCERYSAHLSILKVKKTSCIALWKTQCSNTIEPSLEYRDLNLESSTWLYANHQPIKPFRAGLQSVTVWIAMASEKKKLANEVATKVTSFGKLFPIATVTLWSHRNKKKVVNYWKDAWQLVFVWHTVKQWYLRKGHSL